jgi:general secretion pathway protein J
MTGRYNNCTFEPTPDIIDNIFSFSVARSDKENFGPGKSGMGCGKKAFTLIEVLLAVTLSALLLTIVYWTYFSINRSIDAVTENHEAMETGRVLSELIKRDIRGITAAQFPLVGRNVEIDGRPAGEVEFVTTARLDSDPASFRRVGYALIENSSGERILVRKESRNLKDDLNTAAKIFEISRIINGFQLSFFNGTDWVDKWDSGSQGSLPKQIRVTIDVSDTKGNTKSYIAEEGIQTAPR